MQWYVVTICISMLALGCQRPVEGDTSSIVIQTPKSLKSSSKLGALEAAPSNRIACYGVNVTAPDIESTSSNCSPSTGIVGGFVKAGESLELSVPRGTHRKFELYLYLQKAGQNNPCPTMGKNLSGDLLADTYLIGTTSEVSLQEAVSTVVITTSFPGLTQNLARQLNMPETCIATVTPDAPLFTGLSVSSAKGVAKGIISGSTISLKVRIGTSLEGMPAEGGNYRLNMKSVSH